MASTDRLLTQDGPRNIAEFEVWCKAARKRLQKLIEFKDELGEAACRSHAADLLARAGDFGLLFPHTLCRPRKEMNPSEAIESIEACLSWCSRNLTSDQAGLKVFTDCLEEFAESFAQIRADLALLKQQHTVKEAYTTKEIAEMLGKQEYTVREWCRLGRIAAKKLPNGRGNEGEWRIPHEELIRYQTEGLSPLSPHARLR